MRSLLFGRVLVSLPFVNYGGVLADDGATERRLFDRAAAIAAEHGLSHVELRHFHQHFAGSPAKEHKVTMRLALAPDADRMWDALDRKVRNQVRKAEKSGLSFAIGGAELIDPFYAVFAANMRDLGTPVYSKRLFQEVFAAFPAHATMFVVRTAAGVTAAAGIGIRYRDTVEVPWASSLREYRAQSPNNLLYWGAIRDSIGKGATVFDFGRSTPHEGTYNFKAQWGAQPVPLCWEYFVRPGHPVPNHNPANAKYAAMIAAWKRLPLPLANLIGPPIVRTIP
jgi:FemAB-related protein (PEP-CTERM system-associated)